MSLRFQTIGDLGNPALVCLHGFLGNGNDWRAIVAPLSEQCCCLLPDLPGHGQAARQDGGLEATLTDLVDMLDRHDIQQAGLMGYSLGGRIALHAAVRFPDRFPRLVLESASPGLAGTAEQAARNKLDDERSDQLRQVGLEQFLDEWFDLPLFATMHRQSEKLAALRQSRLDNDPDGLVHSLRVFGTGRLPSLWPQLATLTAPVLLVCGADDGKFVGINQEMASQLGDGRLAVLPEAGHNVHWERPRVFRRLVADFFQVDPK
ncbi:MAG: 2-succinyl-6-hydroxy-2,4-cyclohexadiene-1-carboxylate synthase [bacterium]